MPRSTGNDKERLLLDMADARLAAMDPVGVDVQVMSPTTPGVQMLDADKAAPLARVANDLMAATVRHRPDRIASGNWEALVAGIRRWPLSQMRSPCPRSS